MTYIKIIRLSLWIGYWDKTGKFPFTNPLKIVGDDYLVEIQLNEDKLDCSKNPRKIITDASLKIIINSEDAKLNDGLIHKSKDLYEYAKEKISYIVEESLNLFILKAKLICHLDGLEFQTFLSPLDIFDDFFTHNVEWSKDDKKYTPFYQMKNRSKKINPIYKRKNLLDVTKWNTLVSKFETTRLPGIEVVELYKIKDKLHYKNIKIPLIEAFTIIEVFLHTRVNLVFVKKGIEENKIKDLKKDVTVSVLINILLPLNLTSKELSIYRKDINNIDNLRKVRNKIMHENLSNEKIDREQTVKGINSGIRLLRFLDKKFKP